MVLKVPYDHNAQHLEVDCDFPKSERAAYVQANNANWSQFRCGGDVTNPHFSRLYL